MKKKYTGFYSISPFWAGEAAKKRKPPEDGILLPEIAFIYETDSYSLAVCQDGLIMLHVANLEDRVNRARDKDNKITDIQWSAWGEYFDYLNALHLIFHTITIELAGAPPWSPMVFSFSNVFRFIATDGKIESFELYSKTTAQVCSALLGEEESPVLSKEVFDQLNESFQEASLDITLVKRLSQITKAYLEFQDGNFSYGLILAWLIIESIVMEKWNNLLSDKNTTFDDGRKRINYERKELFIKGRDYSASVVTNMLELHDYLTFKEFSKINTIRGYRNKVIHGDPAYICSSKHSEEAIVLAWKLATEGKEIEAREFLGYMLPYL